MYTCSYTELKVVVTILQCERHYQKLGFNSVVYVNCFLSQHALDRYHILYRTYIELLLNKGRKSNTELVYPVLPLESCLFQESVMFFLYVSKTLLKSVAILVERLPLKP